METFQSLIAGLRSSTSILARRITFPLLLLTAGLLLVQPCAGHSGTWTDTGSLATARWSHTATLLPNGNVLVAGGYDYLAGGYLASAELYDVGLGFSTDVATASPTLTFGHRHLRLTGSRFQGISQASGGNTQDSSSNHPIVQLRSIDSSQVAFLPVDPVRGWSDTTFKSIPVRDFPLGPALITIFTNGIPSDGKYLVVEKRHR